MKGNLLLLSLLAFSWGCGEGLVSVEPDSDDAGGAATDAGSFSTVDAGSLSSDAGSAGNDAGSCRPRGCAELGADCGTPSDGCGGTLSCGGCSSPATCGGSGTPNLCGTGDGHRETMNLAGATGSESGGLIPVCCVPSAAEKADIAEVFRLLNAHRAANGRAALSYDDELEAAIEGHCHHMAAHDFFDHTAPEAAVASPWTRAGLCGTSASGENIAAGQRSPAAVMESWKNSSGHNANMLNASFKRVGVGKASGGAWGVYWGQIFGQ